MSRLAPAASAAEMAAACLSVLLTAAPSLCMRAAASSQQAAVCLSVPHAAAPSLCMRAAATSQQAAALPAVSHIAADQSSVEVIEQVSSSLPGAVHISLSQLSCSGSIANMFACPLRPPLPSQLPPTPTHPTTRPQFGKFSRIAYPGFNCVFCCIGERVAGGLSLRIQQLDVR